MRISLFTLLLFSLFLPAPAYSKTQKADNIILMVADGMGLADVTAARIFRGGAEASPLSFEQLPVIGYQRTFSANSVVTDSAAAASAMATGRKHNNGQISCGDTSPTCADPPPTILEIAKGMGKATGLVATSAITHATPAAFAVHVSSRLCQGEIGRQLIMNSGVDLLLGGGIEVNSKLSPELCHEYADTTPRETIAQARAKGYAVVTTKEELFAAVQHPQPVLGLFGTTFKTVETFRLDGKTPYPEHEPTLAEMTQAALTSLGHDRDGFFLLVEGSQIDWRNHDNDTPGMIAEVLAFDAAVTVVRNQLAAWLMDPKTRQQSTLLIVLSDHDTGGFAITGPHGQPSTPGMVVESGWITKAHTGVDTMVWSQGPGSAKLGRALNNTDIFQVMREALQPMTSNSPRQGPLAR